MDTALPLGTDAAKHGHVLQLLYWIAVVSGKYRSRLRRYRRYWLVYCCKQQWEHYLAAKYSCDVPVENSAGIRFDYYSMCAVVASPAAVVEHYCSKKRLSDDAICHYFVVPYIDCHCVHVYKVIITINLTLVQSF